MSIARRWSLDWHIKKLEIEKLTNILTSDPSLQPSQTSMADQFCKNSQRLKIVDYFLQKGSITDVRLGSKYASIPYMTYLSKNQPVITCSKLTIETLE